MRGAGKNAVRGSGGDGQEFPSTDGLGERGRLALGGRFFGTPVLARGRLPAGATHAGPAIVEEEGATTVVPPELRLRVLDSGDLLMERGDA